MAICMVKKNKVEKDKLVERLEEKGFNFKYNYEGDI